MLTRTTYPDPAEILNNVLKSSSIATIENGQWAERSGEWSEMEKAHIYETFLNDMLSELRARGFASYTGGFIPLETIRIEPQDEADCWEDE